MESKVHESIHIEDSEFTQASLEYAVNSINKKWKICVLAKKYYKEPLLN